MNTQNSDRLALDKKRRQAQKYFTENFSREQRYLIVFERDFNEYLSAAAWLQTEEAKNYQRYYDFLCDFSSLKNKMKEFSWSKKFLLENGIDFAAIRKLYFAIA